MLVEHLCFVTVAENDSAEKIENAVIDVQLGWGIFMFFHP